MCPDTLPAPPPMRQDTRALQPPPPSFIPSHPTELCGWCHIVVMILELFILVGRGDHGEAESRKEERGGGFRLQQDPKELYLFHQHLLFCILLTTHCRSLAKNQQLSILCVFQRNKQK